MNRFLIVSARFYSDIADELERGAREHLAGCGASFDVEAVPGAFEIPAAIRYASLSGRYAGYVALGCVIRGETTHYDYVCAESARGLMELGIQHQLAIGYGILTVEDESQAWVRARRTEGNKGRDAAEAALRMAQLKAQFATERLERSTSTSHG